MLTQVWVGVGWHRRVLKFFLADSIRIASGASHVAVRESEIQPGLGEGGREPEREGERESERNSGS